MGDYRVTIAGVGNHGCDREAKAGGELDPMLCDSKDCIDCRATEFIEEFNKNTGGGIQSATLEHWPSQSPSGPVDDLVNKTRLKGQF